MKFYNNNNNNNTNKIFRSITVILINMYNSNVTFWYFSNL